MKKQKVRFELFRTTIICPKCGEKVRKADEERHLANACSKRLVSCKFCGIVLQAEIMMKHQEYCSTRTDVCKKCGTYVTIRDFAQHLESCEDESVALPCEFCESLFPADELVQHERRCFNDGKVDKSFFLKGGIDAALWETSTKTGNKNNHENVSIDGREELSELKQAFSEGNGSNNRAGKKIPKSHRESISIVALPCEVCCELCPSDKLMQHQLACQQERENTSQNNAETAQHTSPSEHEFVWHRRDSPLKASARYIVVQRGYSPTMEFKDECIFNEPAESDISTDFSFQRGERSSVNFPSQRQETFLTTDDSVASNVPWIEIERSYSPVMEFQEENAPEMFTRNIPSFYHAQDPSRPYERSYPSMFNQAEMGFLERKN